MEVAALLRTLYRINHRIVDGTIDGLSDQHLHATPGGVAHPIAATLAHLVLAEDSLVLGMAARKPTLWSTTWAGKTGVSPLPPESEGYDAWVRSVRVDLPALREYAQAAHAAVDAYLSQLTPDDLDRPIDWRAVGVQNLGGLLSHAALHTANHTGEISAIKGIHGLKGYPL
jgi:uncharacterized damage-inducible protein DinB